MATTLASTTLSAAIDNKQTAFKVASVTNIVKDSILFVDGEAMRVLADPISTYLPQVARGYYGTVAQGHASSAVVWCGPANYFYHDNPTGTATAANEFVLPHVNPVTGTISVISGGKWTKIVDGGLVVPIPPGAVTTYTGATDAITLTGGTHMISRVGAVDACTLAEPDANTPEGTILVIAAGTAYAHTVTYTSGFYANTTSSDVATFGGVIGDSMTIVNIGGAWRVIALNGVTLG